MAQVVNPDVGKTGCYSDIIPRPLYLHKGQQGFWVRNGIRTPFPTGQLRQNLYGCHGQGDMTGLA